MLLSVNGVGQSFTLASGYYDVNASPVNYNCGRIIFNYNTGNSSTSTVNLEVFSIDASNNSNSLGSNDGLPQNFNSTLTYSAPTYLGVLKFYAEFRDASNGNLLFTSSIFTVEIRSIPSRPTITSNSPICQGSNLVFNTANVSGGTFSWTGVNGFSSSTQNPTISSATTAASGSYSATVTVNGCTSPSSTPITTIVNALPVINSLMDTTKVCGTKTILDAGAGYSSYLWNTGATTRYITTDITQNYSVTVTNSSSCSNIDSTYLSIVDAKLFNNDTTILPGSTVNLNAHGILNSADRAVLYDFSNSNALNDFETLTTSGGTVSLTTNGETGNGVEVVRASNTTSDAEMKTTRANFGYGTYEVDAYSASGSADQSFGIMEQSGSWLNRVLYIGTRPDGTDNEGYEVLFNGARIASSGISPVSNRTWYKIKVYITPTSLKVWLNTTVIFDGALPSAITNPRGAIRVGAYDVSRYDNIKYTPLQELSGLWSTNEINQSITVTPTATTTYQLKVTDQTTTCNTSVDIRVLKINITNADASICNNTTQTLFVDSSFSKYSTWQTKKPGIEFYNIKKDLNGNLYALPSKNDEKIFKSIDRGETWNQMAGFPSLGGNNFMALGVDQNNVIYASTNDEGIYKSTDEGVTWTQLQDFQLFGTGPMDILFGNNFSILTVKGIDRGIWTSTGDIVSWQQKVGGFDPNTVTQDIYGNLYSGGSSGLYKSINAGASWTNPSSYRVHIIRADSSGKVFLTEGGTSPLLVSSNQGASFSEINTLSLPNSGVSYPEDILFTNNKMFITKGQVYYSKNNGANFTQLEKITFLTAGDFNYGRGGAPSGGYGDSTNRMEMIGNRLFVASLDGIKFIDVDNLNTTVTWSTGEVGNKIVVNPISTSPGNTVTYSATVSYGAISGSDQVTFTLPSKPTITASGATTFCQGGTVTLTANSSPAGVYSYTWQTGAIAQGINVSSSGSYTVTAINSNGCSETSIPTIITVNPLPTIIINETDASGTTVNDNTICDGASATLTASGGTSYLWNTSETVASITKTPVTTTSYTVTGTNANGCENSATQTITVNVLPAAPTANSTSLIYNGLLQTTLDLIPPSGQSISWFNSLTGGVNSSKPQGINVGTYNSYASATIDATGCISSSRTLVFLEITKKPITITVDPGQTKIYGAANPSTYTYGVSPSLTGLAALNGTLTRVSGESVGIYAIEQNDLTTANNPNYTINYVGNNFTITKKALTITATPGQTKVYGAADPSSYAYTLSTPLLTGDALTGALTRVAGETVGPYAINQGTLTNANYDITYVGNNFTITKKALTITATPGQTKVYGAADPSSYAYILSTPLLTGDALTGALTRVTGETVGPYAINQGTLTNANYDITYVGNNFTITKKALTITATPGQTKVYGAVDPSSYAYTLSTPLLTGDALTGALTRVAGETVGPYAINQGTLTNANYDITYVGNNFTITKKPITITVDAGQTKVYGTANPLTYTYGVSPSLTGLALLNGTLTRASGETVGTYAIEQNDLTTANNPNYTITYVGNNFTITKSALTITATPGQTKVYGAADPFSYAYTLSTPLFGSDALTGTLTRAVGETVGPYAINQGTLTNPNYDITYVGNNFTITPAALSITGITGANKTYDGTTNATINGTASYVGLVPSDAGLTVAGTPSFNFNNKNVGISKPITVTGFASPSANYTLTQPTGLTGDITPKTAIINAVANNKQYDGTTTAIVNLSSPSFITSDIVTINYGSATFDTKEIGTNKTVTVTGINLGSIDAPNYVLASTIATALADITAPPVFNFEIPNAFTPNGDGLNDILKIIGNSGVKELKGFKIYSRSGNLVFETRDLSVGWDGRFKGNMLPSDIYYWTAVYVDRNDQTNSKTGTVLLLK
jgi:gliding motility-associated-like protein